MSDGDVVAKTVCQVARVPQGLYEDILAKMSLVCLRATIWKDNKIIRRISSLNPVMNGINQLTNSIM